MSDIIDYRTKTRAVGMKFAPFDTIDGLNDNQYPFLKEYKSGKLSYTFASTPGEGIMTLFTIPHGLDYIPAGYVISGDTMFSEEVRQYLPRRRFAIWGSPNPFDGSVQDWIKYYFDDTNLVIYYEKIHTGTIAGGDPGHGIAKAGDTIDLNYYIFADIGA